MVKSKFHGNPERRMKTDEGRRDNQEFEFCGIAENKSLCLFDAPQLHNESALNGARVWNGPDLEIDDEFKCGRNRHGFTAFFAVRRV